MSNNQPTPADLERAAQDLLHFGPPLTGDESEEERFVIEWEGVRAWASPWQTYGALRSSGWFMCATHSNSIARPARDPHTFVVHCGAGTIETDPSFNVDIEPAHAVVIARVLLEAAARTQRALNADRKNP